jgi:hypothetical protein
VLESTFARTWLGKPLLLTGHARPSPHQPDRRLRRPPRAGLLSGVHGQLSDLWQFVVGL